LLARGVVVSVDLRVLGNRTRPRLDPIASTVRLDLERTTIDRVVARPFARFALTP